MCALSREIALPVPSNSECTGLARVRGVTDPHLVPGTSTVSKLSLAKCLQPQTLFWPRGCDLLGQ